MELGTLSTPRMVKGPSSPPKCQSQCTSYVIVIVSGSASLRGGCCAVYVTGRGWIPIITGRLRGVTDAPDGWEDGEGMGVAGSKIHTRARRGISLSPLKLPPPWMLVRRCTVGKPTHPSPQNSMCSQMWEGYGGGLGTKPREVEFPASSQIHFQELAEYVSD